MIANDDAKRARRSIGINWGVWWQDALLITQQGKPLTHQKLLQTVWGPDHGEETENLRVVINQLRKKIEKDPTRPRYILTEPWLGYRFGNGNVANAATGSMFNIAAFNPIPEGPVGNCAVGILGGPAHSRGGASNRSRLRPKA